MSDSALVLFKPSGKKEHKLGSALRAERAFMAVKSLGFHHLKDGDGT